VISTPVTIHISAQTPTILPAGFLVRVHNVGIDYFFKFPLLFRRTMRRNSVVITANRYRLDGPGFEPRWVRDFTRTFTLGLWPNQPPIKRVAGSFPEVKQPGRGVDHPPTPDDEVKERVEPYFSSRSVHSWPIQGYTSYCLLR